MAGGIYFSRKTKVCNNKVLSVLGQYRLHGTSTVPAFYCFDYISFYSNILKFVGVYDRCIPLFDVSVEDCCRLICNGYFVLFRFPTVDCLTTDSFWFHHCLRSCYNRKGKVCVSNYEILFANASVVKRAEVAFVMSGNKKKICLSECSKKILNSTIGYMCCRSLEFNKKNCSSNIHMYAQILHFGRYLTLTTPRVHICTRKRIVQ